MKRLVPILAVLLLGGLAAWWFDLPARFGFAEARNGPIRLYGNVDIRQVELGFRVGGRISAMEFDEGDSVKAGDLLARLDTKPYEDALAAAEAQAGALRAQLDKLVAGPRIAEISQARAQLDEQTANYENAKLTYERAAQLRPGGTVSQSVLDSNKAARDAALARVVSAQQALDLLLEGSRKEDIAAARASLQGAEANIAAAQTALDDAQLKAPASGTILSRLREPGAIIATSDIVYVLSLDRPVWVRGYVSEPLLGKIHPGLEVTVTTDSAPDRPYRGKVGFISPVAEFTPKSVETPELRTDLVYRLRVVIDAPDQGLRQGMPVTVHIPEPSGP
ncbi:secretion protein HlyD [Nordella sp. HKS 07]|uniref:secretion protein HlyD n=1 Tax=Nordella sp. HKS 07 TaxID=2712222 RepID=UPI0013E1A800|nr:secretion protein HlyD [Nordella sp. HKS 07]QIG49723.1 secretion protein HlyD [Nordella sp. HKS 07]